MGCMHAPGKGLSQSALPYLFRVSTWLKLMSDDLKEQIYKLAKKGPTPSQIGVILSDSQGVTQELNLRLFCTWADALTTEPPARADFSFKYNPTEMILSRDDNVEQGFLHFPPPLLEIANGNGTESQ
ncbi:40S ribosomal protein S13 [Myotis davidii]|uniref:40S ribosomal protein S13 n=1 Tax=Myotis davidii TaxID=225400 RepID=L5M6U0_MYODS|nr:40S ribosomal protein S13 [Myotis davidii]